MTAYLPVGTQAQNELSMSDWVEPGEICILSWDADSIGGLIF